MFELYKEMLGNAFLVLGAGWILTHLVLIALKGKVLIYEPNRKILIAEIVFTFLIILLGAGRFIGDLVGG